MSDQSRVGVNPYVSVALPRLYLKTTTPIVFIMVINGLFTVIDALFLGIYVGAAALTAVTLMFPIFMLIVSLSTLVGNGMASIIARQIGAEDFADAEGTLLSAMTLAMAISATLIAGFLLAGDALITATAGGDPVLKDFGRQYIAVLIYCSPLTFLLSVHGDAMRSEGHVGVMAMIAAGSTVLNIGFNFLLIAVIGLGVFGSALGTVLAQSVSFVLVIGLRLSGRTRLRLVPPPDFAVLKSWPAIFALGLPSSLTYLGISIVSGIIIFSLQVWAEQSYPETVAAYGVITRIMTFVFLPLLGLNLASQSIVGNNFGARAFARSNRGLLIAVCVALGYCLAFEAVLGLNAAGIGGLFVNDRSVVSEIARILPVTILTLFLFGPTFILSGYFQALGDAGRAAWIGLSRTYLFAIPLTLTLPFVFGEWGIWYAGPASEIAMLGLTIAILAQNARRTGARLGLFISET